MANKTNTPQEPKYDALLQVVVDNLNSFIDSINCIKETYEFSEVTLRDQLRDADLRFDDFITSHEHKDVDGRSFLEIPEDQLRSLLRLIKKKDRATRAIELVPPSYFVSLVSVYDSFFGGLVRCLYSICPEKLQDEDMTFCYRDLQKYDSLTDVKKRIIDKRVEKLLRDSHVEQIDWFASALGVSTLRSFKGWPDFVEVTERRNLFVHANGTVSTQYMDNCKKHSALDSCILEGNQLTVDKTYFDKAFKTLYKIAIMLSQMLLRIKYCEKAGQACVGDIDKILIENVFDLIVDKHYDTAIDVSEMVLSNPKFSHNAFDRLFIVLNYAQSYKWSGNQEKCQEILDKEDWSAFTNELLIPKFTLEENYPEVYKRMRELGKGNKHISITSYREWPVFQKLREQEEFKNVFEEVFGEAFGEVKSIEIGHDIEMREASTTDEIVETPTDISDAIVSIENGVKDSDDETVD